MKRNILAVSVAAALGMVAGSASASPILKASGVGMVNVIPYFSTQGNNVTQISITNTDLVYGKAVKVRFRGAEWSDDIFDFTVFLSPGDVFTGAVTNNGSGVSTFATSDGSCTLPETVNQAFPTFRLHNSATGTLEGYVEIINMGDINPLGDQTGALSMNLYDAITHVHGVAPCKDNTSDAFTLVQNLDEDSVTHIPTVGIIGQDDDWILPPSTGLTSWNRVIDIAQVKAYGVPAAAYDLGYGAAVTGEIFFRQRNVARAPDATLTADQIFYPPATLTGVPATTFTSPVTAMYQFDMPDLTTLNDSDYTTAAQQRNAITAILQKASVMSEFSTLASVSGATDVVLAQPTRRYYYTYLPHTHVATDVLGTDYSRMVGSTYVEIYGETLTPYEALTMDNRVPLADLGGLPAAYGATPAVFWDREEQFNATSSEIVISPTPPSAAYTVSLKGEASVVSVNRGAGATTTGALGASLTMNDITVSGGYQTGWMMLSTTADIAGGDLALPIIGFTALNVKGANNYGTTLPLRYFGAAGTIGH